jgi:DNA processing protein
MAVPGPITSPTSLGTNQLIRDGAEPLLSLDDLLAHYPELARQPSRDGLRAGVGPRRAERSPEDQSLFRALGERGRHLDEIATTLARPVGLVLAQLGQLELEGLVEQLPGRVFRPVEG